jgi:hypothetical protein
MDNFVNRILAAYRPLYLRGLMMDGQYRLPAEQVDKPQKGNRAVQPAPAFDPRRKHAPMRPAAAPASLCAAVPRKPSNGLGRP